MIVFFSVLNLIISEIKEKEITDELENMDSIENKEPNEKSFEYKFRTNSSFDYYIIRTYEDRNNKLYSSPMHIYMHPNQVASASNYYRASNLYHENIIAIKKNFAKEFYITVICPYQCKGKLTYYVSNYVHLNLNEHFEFIGGENYTIALNKNDVFENEAIQVVLLGPQMKLEGDYMKFGYLNKETQNIEFSDDYPVRGLLIKNNELSYVIHGNNTKYEKAYKYVLIRISGPNGHFMRFMTRHIGNGYYTIGEPALYSLKELYKDFTREECVNIIGQSESEDYQFRIVTTNALNFTMGEYKKSLGYMEDYYKLIPHGEKIEKISFISNQTTDKFGEIKETEKQAFYFQIIRTKKKSIDAIIEPLYEGWVYRDQLEKGESRFYRHAKWTNKKTNVIIMSNKGTLNAYQGKCITFPFCWNYSQYQNFSKLIYTFSGFVSSIDPKDETHYGDSSQVVHFIECKDDNGCLISIEYIDQNEIVLLKENENHGKFIEYGGKEDYKIIPLNKGIGNKIEVNLEIFSGDAVLQFENEFTINSQYLFYGSTEKYIFNESEIAGQILLVSVVARKNTYYVISYRHIKIEKDETRIGESGLLLQLIQGIENSVKYFTFYHISPTKKDTPYIVNFIPINCEIEAYFESFVPETNENRKLKPNLFGQYEDILYVTNPKFNEITPKYYIQFKKFIFNITKDNYFLVYDEYQNLQKNFLLY